MNRKAAFFFAALGVATPLAEQEGIKPPALNQSCGVPMSKLATPAPLPNLAAALKRETTIDIIAIGSSSTFGIGASTLDRTYPVQLQEILERTFKGYDFFHQQQRRFGREGCRNGQTGQERSYPEAA